MGVTGFLRRDSACLFIGDELCTNYGEIHGIWWDMNVPGHRDPSVNQMIRSRPGWK